jgi:CcmD family protein
MKKKSFILFCMYSLLLVTVSFAQGSGEAPGMAVGMRSNGKIYVVVAVIVTILLGLFLYLSNLDKKISKLEKELKQGNEK